MAKKVTSYRINKGQSKSFLYVGNFIPNVVGVKNLGANQTRFTLTSEPRGWIYYGRVAGNRQIAISVVFPDGKLTFHNEGPAPIGISGEDLRPA